MYIKSFGGQKGGSSEPLEPPLPTGLWCHAASSPGSFQFIILLSLQIQRPPHPQDQVSVAVKRPPHPQDQVSVAVQRPPHPQDQVSVAVQRPPHPQDQVSVAVPWE